MPEIPDYDLVRTDGPLDTGRTGLSRLWSLAIATIVVAGGLAYFIYSRQTAPTPAPAAKAVQATEEAVRPLGGTPEGVSVPPLDESDAVVRELVRKLSSHPAVAAWLLTNGLIRNFTVTVANVAEGVTPAKHLRALRPSSSF